LGELQLLQLEYWDGLHKVLNQVKGPISGDRKPQPQSWMSYSIGRSGLACNAAISRPQNHVRVEIYISNPYARSHFEQLLDQRAAIEAEFGEELEWPDMEGKRDRKVYCALEISEFEDQSDWPRQHAWLAGHLNRMHRAFQSRVRLLENQEVE